MGTVGAPLVDELLRRGEKVKAASRRAVAQLPSGAEPVRVDLEDPGTSGRRSPVSTASMRSRRRICRPAGAFEAGGRSGRGTQAQGRAADGDGGRGDDAFPFRQLELMIERSGDSLRDSSAELVFRQFRQLLGVGRCARRDQAAGRRRQDELRRRPRHRRFGRRRRVTSNRHDGKAFALTGPAARTAIDEAAICCLEALGRRITYRSTMTATSLPSRAADGLPELYATLLAGIFHPVRDGWTSVVTDAVETLSGGPPRSLASSIVDLAARLKVAA